MPNVEARIKIKGKQYEILVDLDEALKIKNNQSDDVLSALQSNGVYYDIHKGTHVPNAELEEAFGTTDNFEIAKKIISSGEIQKTQDYRDEEREKKQKQVISLLARNAVDSQGRPYTEERLKSATKEAGFNFDNRPPEQQMTILLEKLKKIIPIKIETKKIKIIVPAKYTGQVYGLIPEYKESEEWLSNGNLEAILNIPSGVLLDFYDKLNSLTHGSAQTEEIKQ